MDETTWTQKGITGLAIILNSVSVEWTDLVASKSTAHEAWQALADKFDRQNATTFHHMLSQLCTLQMDDNASLPDHLNSNAACSMGSSTGLDAIENTASGTTP